MSQTRINVLSVNNNAKLSKVTKKFKGADSRGRYLCQEEQCLYSPLNIKRFLQKTKRARLVKVEDHFTDLRLFVESVKPLTKKKQQKLAVLLMMLQLAKKCIN